MASKHSQYQPASRIVVAEYFAEQGKLILSTPTWDFDEFEPLGGYIVKLLSANIIEKQTDADIHSWLIDFEGCHFLMKAEHYSECVWLEALEPKQSQQECQFLASWLQ